MMDLTLFFKKVREENVFLRRNGGGNLADAREQVLLDLKEYVETMERQEVPIDMAADLAGVHTETVYRALRSRKIPRGPMGGVLRADLPKLKGRRRLDKEEKISQTTSRLRQAAINSV